MLNYSFKYIRLTYLKENFGNETDFYKEIIIEAQTNIPEIVAQLKLYLENKEWKQLGSAAHQLKGVVQIFGLDELAVELKQLQYMTEKGQGVETYTAVVDRTAQVCDEVLRELKIALSLL